MSKNSLGIVFIYIFVVRPVLYCIIPLLVLVVSTIILAVKLRQLNRHHSVLTRQQHQRNNVTCLLIILLSVFIICSLPWPTLITILLIDVLAGHGSGFEEGYKYLASLIWFFHILNSSVNCVVYMACSRYYRQRILSAKCFSACIDADQTRPDQTQLDTILDTCSIHDSSGREAANQEIERSSFNDLSPRMHETSTPSEVTTVINSAIETDCLRPRILQVDQ